MNELKIIAGAELTVGDVEKIGAPHEAAERHPGFPMGGAVLGVSVRHLEENGTGAVGADRENPKQLLEVGPVILVVMWLAT